MKKPETLLETVPYMIDERFECRLIAEYFQSKIRLEKLEECLSRKTGLFSDDAITKNMHRQVQAMDVYVNSLKERILYLGIDRIIEGGL